MRDKLLIIIITFHIIWSAIFIFKSSFTIGNNRYFCLADDAMITMSYAKNLTSGLGLNWAKYGNPVEGYTHPLWLGFMIIANIPFIPMELRSLIIQIISEFFLVLSFIYIKKLISEFYLPKGSRFWIAPVALTASLYSLNYWSLMGMETGFQVFLIISGLYYLHKITLIPDTVSKSDKYKFALILGLCLLLRMDMIFFVIITFGFLLNAHLQGKINIKNSEIVWMLSIILVPISIYEIFRIIYFNDILPNTYYLKMTGTPFIIRIYRGIKVLLDYLYTIIVPFIVFLIYSYKRINKQNIGVLLVVVLAFLAYSAYSGGDVWELTPIGANRFITPVLPLIFIILTVLIYDIVYNKNKKNKMFITVFIIVYLGLSFNTLSVKNFNNYFLIDSPVNRDNNRKMLISVLETNELVKNNGVVAVVWAGIPGFFGNYKLADIFGYNDNYLAKKDSYYKLDISNHTDYLPGHMKIDYEYLMREKQVDLFLHIIDDHKTLIQEFKELAYRYDYELVGNYWVKISSSNIIR